MKLVLVFAAVLAVTNAGRHDKYSGYSVHGVKLSSRDDQKLVHELELSMGLDIWSYGSVARRDALVMVSPDKSNAFLDKLDKNGIDHYLHLADVSDGLDKHDDEIARWRSSRSGRLVPFEDYPRYAEINEYLERIAAQYPDIVTLVNAGPSFEGRRVNYLKISTTNFMDTSKPVYFMDAMIHAREWVTTPVALYSIHRLVEDLQEQDRDLLEQIDWIIMPLVNPDGYEYSHTDDRMWRRTRSINLEVSTTCVGVDGNRNFDYMFNTVGVSSDPCSDIYPGPEAFSEVEIRYIRDLLFENLDRIQVFLDIHSFGNYILFAFSNLTLPANAPQLHHMSATMGAVIDSAKLPEAWHYLVGNNAMILYPTSGSADDYAQEIGVPFSMCLELPDYGRDFRVPPEYIEQINKETWLGIAATARQAIQYHRLRQN